MAAPKPDDGMYGIKLIYPAHLELTYFVDDFDGTDGKHTLMNFSSEGRGPAVATNLPVGHKALVYVSKEQRFVQAIEIVGTTEEGRRAADAHGITADMHEHFKLYRPIRILKRIRDLDRAPKREQVCAKSGVDWRSYGASHQYIKADQYQRMYDSIEWDS